MKKMIKLNKEFKELIENLMHILKTDDFFEILKFIEKWKK